MDDVASLLNHTRTTPLRVVGKERHNISSGDYCRLKVILKVVIWSSGSFRPSNDSSYGRKNFRGIGHSRTFVVKGEFVLLTLPSRFRSIFSFITSLSLTISLLISLRMSKFASSEVFGRQWSSLLRISPSSSRLVPILVGERFSSCYNYNLISWFCQGRSSTLAVSVWICSASVAKSCGVLDSIWTLGLNGTTLSNRSMKLSFPQTMPN